MHKRTLKIIQCALAFQKNTTNFMKCQEKSKWLNFYLIIYDLIRFSAIFFKEIFLPEFESLHSLKSPTIFENFA